MWRRIVLTIAVVAVGLGSEARDKKMDAFIGKLMSKMTLSEKIGQLNLQPGGDVSTGGAMDTELSGLIARGELGAVLNTVGRDKIRAMQQIAVEKTRLGIPLLVGLDVIHGYQTIFPIPLAQSCSWNPAAIEQGARIAAEEATSDGIDWTYSPMVDIALDARWGRIAEGNGEDPYLGGLIAQALVRGYQGDFDGSATYSRRTIQHVNPALSDDNAYDLAAAIGALQVYPVNGVSRQDTVTLVRE